MKKKAYKKADFHSAPSMAYENDNEKPVFSRKISESDIVDQAEHYTIQLVYTADKLFDYAEAWSDLGLRSLEENIFYLPECGLAAAKHLADGDVFWVLIWDQVDPDKLMALFPLKRNLHRWAPFLGCAQSWTHLFSVLGSPLIDAAENRKVITSFLKWWTTRSDLPSYIQFPYLECNNRLWISITEIASSLDMNFNAYDQHERALLQTVQNGDVYLSNSLGTKRKKEYRRIRRRLAEQSQLDLVINTEHQSILSAFDRFCRIENSGWKGNRKTALLNQPDWNVFFEQSLKSLASVNSCRIAELMVDNVVIASTIIITHKRKAWLWKTAFNEDYAKYSPGVLLMHEVTRQLAGDKGLDSIDSCAIPGHQMIDRIWRERLSIADLVISVRPNPLRDQLVHHIENARLKGRNTLKKNYNLLRRKLGR